MAAQSGPISPLYLAAPIEVTIVIGAIERYDQTSKLWKGPPFGGRTPMFDKSGKQVGTIGTAEFERAEVSN